MVRQQSSSSRQNPEKPQKYAEQIVEIHDVAFGGNGVGRVGGKIWFVPFTWRGEKVRARPVEIKKEYVRAELLSVITPTPARVQPPCVYFGTCGGCKYQHVNYESQLEMKREQVAVALARIAGLRDFSVDPVTPSPEQFGYRNRITVHVENGVTGFHRADGKGLMEIERCEIASEPVNRMLKEFRDSRPFDGHRTLREGNSGAEGFCQTNDVVAGLLLQHVEALLEGATGRLVDAYCGSGFFARALSDRFSEVLGLDWSQPAIRTALRKAGENEHYMEGDVEANLENALLASPDTSVCVLLDPPAEGISRKVADILLENPPERIVYVSCNPSTFARDISRLEGRFHLESVRPFDMFPQTAQIELAALLTLTVGEPVQD